MSNPSRYPITVDGTRLDTWARNISTRTGRDIGAPIKGSNSDSAMKHGELYIPNKKYGPGTVVLSMWVRGCDDDGNPPLDGDSYYQYRKNLDALRLLLGPTHRPIDVRQQLDAAGSVIRQADCELRKFIDPEMISLEPAATLSVELGMSDAFWRDVADVTFGPSAALTSGVAVTATEFIGMTAPVDDLWVILYGPATNPEIYDDNSGHFVKYSGTVPNGQQWVMDTSNYTSKVGTAIEFTTGGTDVSAQTTYAGAHNPKFFGLVPSITPKVRVNGTGFGANTKIKLRGKRNYL